MLINQLEFVHAISYALDYLEISTQDNITNHSKRVALIALKIGKKLSLSNDDLIDLFCYSMLHDNGFTSQVYYKVTKETRDGMERIVSHCIVGEENIQSFPFITKRENIIKYHHECYDGTGYFGVKGDDIPFLSQIIALADTVELLYRALHNKHKLRDHIQNCRNTKFSPELCDVFDSLLVQTSFWLSLEDIFLESELNYELPSITRYFTLESFYNISKILSKIIDAKSPFTGLHSQELADKMSKMADYYCYNSTLKMKLIIAAYLHDIGKLVTPNTIIDKNGRLTEEEFDTIKSHPYYTRKILGSISGLEDIVNWASDHHEKLNGTGYPYGLDSSTLSFEAQLIACLDIYQALTEDRPYRTPLTHEEAIKIMTSMVDRGEINSSITEDIGICFA